MKPPKFRINNSYSSPININYDLRGLYKYEYIEMQDPAHKGELVKVDYFVNFAGGDPNDINNYIDKALTEERVYTRDPATNLLIYRDQTIKWYLEDGTIGEKKVGRKTYQLKDAIEEGEIRRDNIITYAKLYLLSSVGLDNGQTLLAELGSEINIYIHGNHQPLIDAVNASTDPFMTALVKATTISILDF